MPYNFNLTNPTAYNRTYGYAVCDFSNENLEKCNMKIVTQMHKRSADID